MTSMKLFSSSWSNSWSDLIEPPWMGSGNAPKLGRRSNLTGHLSVIAQPSAVISTTMPSSRARSM